MKPRYYPRAVVQGTAVCTTDRYTVEGQVLALTVPGCLIHSPLAPNKGDSVTLRGNLPQEGVIFQVARGVVRWVQGSCFGVEFIEMDQHERVRYNTTVTTLLRQQKAARRARLDQTHDSRQLSGVNWHLEEHEMSTPPLPCHGWGLAAGYASRRGGGAGGMIRRRDRHGNTEKGFVDVVHVMGRTTKASTRRGRGTHTNLWRLVSHERPHHQP